jgi:Protein of unknown function (DUF1186)/SEC-C motif
MDATEILAALASSEALPVDAIRAASADRATVVPLLLQAFERYVSGEDGREIKQTLFFAFHLLGEWREKSAYRPLAAFIRLPREEIDDILSDAITVTSHRVMAAVCDGDARPLCDVICDPDADEFIRSRMFEALAMLVLRGELAREEVARFLGRCHAELEPQDECFVWNGWQAAIAMLGLLDLVPLVRQAFERGFLSPSWLSFKDFHEDLQLVLSGAPHPSSRAEREYILFGDTIEELSRWYGFSAEYIERKKARQKAVAQVPDVRNAWSRNVPITNPLRGVGRNDPCPCGSGRKFKKCCLGKTAADVGNGGEALRL